MSFLSNSRLRDHFLIILGSPLFNQFTSSTTPHNTKTNRASTVTMEATENQEEIVTYRNEKLAGTVNWGTATVVGVFTGMLYGGSKEASASVAGWILSIGLADFTKGFLFKQRPVGGSKCGSGMFIWV